MKDLERLAALTGGASGIGAATAALLGDRGAGAAVLDLKPLSGSTTGTVLGVDGGMVTLRLPW